MPNEAKKTTKKVDTFDSPRMNVCTARCVFWLISAITIDRPGETANVLCSSVHSSRNRVTVHKV